VTDSLDVLLFYIVAVAIVTLPAATRQGYHVLQRRRRVRVWCEAARAAGLDDVMGEAALRPPRVLTARAGAHAILLEELGWSVTARDRERMHLTIEGNSGLTLRAEDLDTLDVETCRILRPLMEGILQVPGARFDVMLRIHSGNIVATFPAKDALLLRRHFGGVLQPLLAVAHRLQRPEGIAARIAEEARQDPEWRVRLANLRRLVRQYPQHPATRAALEQSCHDERQEIQLEAALAQGPEKGEATLWEIATAEWSADAHAAQAVAALGKRLPPDRVQVILERALRSRRSETASACLDVLGQHGGSAVVGPLSKVLAVVSGDLAVEAAHALGASGAASAETPLLDALGNDARAVRVAAAQALGRVGSAAAVLPLQERSAADRRDASLQQAARQAIAAIQSRVGAATRGALSLAESETGKLSLVDQEPRGRISIVDRKHAV
jgi:hypothetical protein